MECRCRWCRRIYDSDDSGASWWYRKQYCSERCERAAENSQKGKKKDNIGCSSIIVIIVIILGLVGTCVNSDEESTSGQSESLILDYTYKPK